MKKRLGDLMVEMGYIGDDQLSMALMEAKKTGTMLGEVLKRLDWITDEQLQMCLAVQSGAQILDTKTATVELGVIDKIPLSFVTAHGVFPFQIAGGIVKMATTNPFDVISRDELARLTGFQVQTYIAPREWIQNAIERYYKMAKTIDEDIERIATAALTGKSSEEDEIVKLADLIIEKGSMLGASDIHIVADVNLTRIYYRVDGVLNQTYLFPKSFHQSLATRFKIMGNMDISNPNIPHDGRIKYTGRFSEFNLRVSSFPTQIGETVVMRLLLYQEVVGDLERLGFDAADLALFRRSIRRPYGLILTTGPTGSGKTTSLYSALMTINSPNINVMTIEDPIEYVIPTIRQTAINPKAGLTFSNALRAAMRQDPDVILVGEIRDQETAELAMRASITGHLVLSTLHTNDAASAINRLLDLGINASLLATALVLVVAQRLIRKICPHCLAMTPPSVEETEIFVRNALEAPIAVPRPNGCDSCNQNGYSGRIGIYEVIKINKAMEELIFTGALHSTIEAAAVASGTSLLIKQALKKVLASETSLEEVLRVVAADA
ncbi:MAG: GspE/PulE family protein [Pseudomonadota bacterium]